MHEYGHKEDDEEAEDILTARKTRAADARKPARARRLVDGAYAVRALRVLPEANRKSDKLQRDIVHHEGEQSLVRVVARLKIGRNQAPDHAEKHAARNHEGKEQRIRNLVAEQYHEPRARNAADQYLSLRAYIPEAHAKGRGEAHRN